MSFQRTWTPFLCRLRRTHVSVSGQRLQLHRLSLRGAQHLSYYLGHYLMPLLLPMLVLEATLRWVQKDGLVPPYLLQRRRIFQLGSHSLVQHDAFTCGIVMSIPALLLMSY